MAKKSVAMARGTIFLDEDSLNLEVQLQKNNIRVIKAQQVLALV